MSDYGNEFVIKSNKITDICRKFQAQNGMYGNSTHLKTDKKGDITGFQTGSKGGTIVFHAGECDMVTGAAELLLLLKEFGLGHIKHMQEIVRTHRVKDGTPYKKPLIFIEQVN
jgi:hypothetical protein